MMKKIENIIIVRLSVLVVAITIYYDSAAPHIVDILIPVPVYSESAIDYYSRRRRRSTAVCLTTEATEKRPWSRTDFVDDDGNRLLYATGISGLPQLNISKILYS